MALLNWLVGGGVAAMTIADTMRDNLARGGGADTLAPGISTGGRAAYDRLVDALNRLPRPLSALGTLAVISAALIDPVWFATRMDALAAMPEPMWWLLGAVVSLHFGGRMQVYAQAFRRDTAQPAALLPDAPLSAAPVPAGPVPAPITQA